MVSENKKIQLLFDLLVAIVAGLIVGAAYFFLPEQQRLCPGRGRRSRNHYALSASGSRELVDFDDRVQSSHFCFAFGICQPQAGIDFGAVYAVVHHQ